MKTKIFLKTTALLLTLCTVGMAVQVKETDGNKNTRNEIDDAYVAQKGWSFYIDSKETNTTKKSILTKKIELYLLQKILDENKKQTKIQTKILALLQEQMDPKPKEITVNGKKCIANSSAECFQMPLIAEAKRVPVLANWLKDPYSVTKAAKYLQWQAKYFDHVINAGNSLQFAYAQFGQKAYPIGAQSLPYTVGSGKYEGSMLPQAQDKLILSMKEKISFDIFIGKNINMDIYSALSVIELIKKYGSLNIQIIYFDQKSKDVFEGAIASVWKINDIKYWNKIKKTINPEMFEQFDIFTTPSYVIKIDNKGQKEAQTLLHGKIDTSAFRNATISYLELKKLIDYKNFTEQKAWNSKAGSQVVKKLYKDQYGVDVSKFTTK